MAIVLSQQGVGGGKTRRRGRHAHIWRRYLGELRTDELRYSKSICSSERPLVSATKL